MPLELIDTHCHRDLEPLSGTLDAVLGRAREAGVRHCLSIGTTLDSSRANVALAQREPMVRAAVGVHPHDAHTLTPTMLKELETLAADPGVVAIGEVGLDYFRGTETAGAQQHAFSAFIELSTRRNLPLVIHCRQAYEPLLEMLRQAPRSRRGVIHCASGPPQFIHTALELGFSISFAGNVTFPNAQALRQLVALVPDDRLLLETDAPFLAPQPVRGQKNEPAFVTHTARTVASLRGTTLEHLGELTSRNARHLFGIAQVTEASVDQVRSS